MSDLRREIDDIPVTLVVAIAYATLAVVTGMMGDGKEFQEQLVTWGWLHPGLAAGEPWRLLSYAFLHGNVLHLLINMASLWALGPALERSLGSAAFAGLYVVSALGGGIAVCLWSEHAVVGGSGALFGMMGAAVAMNMRSGRHVFAFLDFEGPRRVLSMIAVNLLLGFLIPVVSNAGHIGGLIAGFGATFLWLRPGPATPARRAWRLAAAALLATWLFAAVVPVTRADWLERAAAAADDPGRREALFRAAVRASPDGFGAPQPDGSPRRRR